MNPIAFRNLKNELFFKSRRASSLLFGLVGTGYLLFGRKTNAAKFLMQSHRIYGRDTILTLALKFDLLNDGIVSKQCSKEVPLEEAAGRSIVIKYPSFLNGKVSSKGILIIAFTKTFSFYLNEVDVDLLSKYFHIVLEPSWSGYMDADILGWMHKTNNIVYVQATEIQDRIMLNALRSNLKPVSFGASDWVDFEHFSPQDAEKLYDSIYIANTNPIKRIVRYLVAVRNIVKEMPDYKGCLVCAMWGDNPASHITQLVAQLGIENSVDVMFALKKDQLKTVLSKSRTNVLLSYKEGSNRSLFESMFMDVPAICLAENIGTNKAYINEYTGILTTNNFLEEALLDMKNNWANFAPRQWALENISPVVTTQKILRIIENYENTYIDVKDVYIKVNNPEFHYFHYQSVDFHTFNTNLLRFFLASTGNEHIENELIILQDEYNSLFVQQPQ